MTRLKTHGLVACAIAQALPGAAALAQHAHTAPNGGQIQQIGAVEGELLVKGREVTLFLVDANEKKVDSTPYTATASVLAAGNQQKAVELKPAGDNRLAAPIDFPVDGKFRAALTLKKSGADVGRARYSLDAR